MTSDAKSTVFAAYGHDCNVQTVTDVDVVLKLIQGNSICARLHRWFSRLIVVSEKCKVHTSNLRSYGAFLKEQERQLTHFPNRLHPQSLLRLCWEIFIVSLIFIDLMLHGIDLPFLYEKETFVHYFSWKFVRIFVEVILLTNIIVGLFTGYYDDIAQEIVFNLRRICLHNLKTDILFFISVIPIQIPVESYIPVKQRYFVIILYVIKLPLLFTFHGYYKRVLEFFEVKHHAYLKTIIIIYMVLYVHLLCCYLIFVRKSVMEYEGVEIRLSVNNPEPPNVYVSGIYHASIVLYTAGYGKNEPNNQLENFFICTSWYLSRLFFIFVLACFMESIKVSTSSRSRYLALEHELEEYMRHKQLPSYMRNRIYTYYEFRFQKRYFREDEILNTISGQLRQEINMHACKKLVENVSFFRNLPMNLLVRIISCLQIQVFLTNDVIIRAGTPGKCMYFISTGTVAVYTKSGKEKNASTADSIDKVHLQKCPVLIKSGGGRVDLISAQHNRICHLKDGDHFGEVSLLYKDTLRIASVISIEISEIYTLDKKDFVKAIYPYPDLLSNIQNIAADRMETAFMLDEHNKSELAQRKILYDVDH